MFIRWSAAARSAHKAIITFSNSTAINHKQKSEKITCFSFVIFKIFFELSWLYKKAVKMVKLGIFSIFGVIVSLVLSVSLLTGGRLLYPFRFKTTTKIHFSFLKRWLEQHLQLCRVFIGSFLKLSSKNYGLHQQFIRKVEKTRPMKLTLIIFLKRTRSRADRVKKPTSQ